MNTAAPSYISAWIRELGRLARRHRLVLTTLGYAHEPLRPAVFELSEHVFTVAEYLSSSQLGPQPALVLISDMETCVKVTDSNRLGSLRERITADLDMGLNFIMVSRFPRIRFPAVPGSSLLEDAKLIFPPLAPGANADPTSVLPICAHDRAIELNSVLTNVLGELGDEVLAALDHALFELMCNRDQVPALLEARVIEAIHGAGLLAVDDSGSYKWTMPMRFGELRNSVADALARMTNPSDILSKAFGSIWSLERTIRGAMRAKALAVWGSRWRQQALNGDLPRTVLGRATSDAYVAAKSIKELRDPFEWLTLAELLELRKRPEYGDLGLESVVWKMLANEVLPIRNRLSHMRLLQDGDLPTVTKWQVVLDRKLESS